MKIPALFCLFCLFAVCLLAGCPGEKQQLVVKQYILRDQGATGNGDPMVRQEKLRRLYGAVSLEERKAKLGQYYTILWSLPESSGSDRKIVFRYQQGGSGSRVKTMTRQISQGSPDGKEEFAVIGDDYFDDGRVLAWKTDLLVDGKIVASEKSYLWE